jgi:hypothetical protein
MIKRSISYERLKLSDNPLVIVEIGSNYVPHMV